jgi:hypothetical protein
MVYVPTGEAVEVDLSQLHRPLDAWWYCPRTGSSYRLPAPESERAVFVPPGLPSRGNDWVLVLDDRSLGFPPPGAEAQEAEHSRRRGV